MLSNVFWTKVITHKVSKTDILTLVQILIISHIFFGFPSIHFCYFPSLVVCVLYHTLPSFVWFVFMPFPFNVFVRPSLCVRCFWWLDMVGHGDSFCSFVNHWLLCMKLINEEGYSSGNASNRFYSWQRRPRGYSMRCTQIDDDWDDNKFNTKIQSGFICLKSQWNK